VLTGTPVHHAHMFMVRVNMPCRHRDVSPHARAMLVPVPKAWYILSLHMNTNNALAPSPTAPSPPLTYRAAAADRPARG